MMRKSRKRFSVRTRVKRAIPIRDNKPAKTETILPATKGSEKILSEGIVAHINRGCLPSDKGKNRNEGSLRMI